MEYLFPHLSAEEQKRLLHDREIRILSNRVLDQEAKERIAKKIVPALRKQKLKGTREQPLGERERGINRGIDLSIEFFVKVLAEHQLHRY